MKVASRCIVPNDNITQTKTLRQNPKMAELCGIEGNFCDFVALQGSAGYFFHNKKTAVQLCKSGLRNILISAHFCPLLFTYGPEFWWCCFMVGQYWLFSRQKTAMESACHGILVNTRFCMEKVFCACARIHTHKMNDV